jgi:L-ascorbate metabolism protein UlaG (beta-lactamase superfamily)
MEITWLGHSCFRLKGRDATVLTDPCPPSTGYKIGRVPADVVTISHDAPETSYRQAVTGEAKFIAGPGEFEIGGVLITAVRTPNDKRKDGGGPRNVAYVIDIDDIRICHLGDLSQVPTGDDVETLSAADILLLPVGGATLSPSAAVETVSLLEPKIVIPMQFQTDASTAALEGVDKFLREMGSEAKKPEPRLTITKSAIPHDTTIVVLEYRG